MTDSVPLTNQAIRSALARAIGWRKAQAVPDGQRGEKPKFTPAVVPSIVDDFFTKADQLGIPVLGQIVTAPSSARTAR